MKKKVLFISPNDWANSGFRYTQAVNRHSEKYECKYFAINSHPFGYIRDNVIVKDGVIDHEVLNEMRQYSKECDIIHCKENCGFIGGFEDVKFDLDKPTVQTFGGSVYRANHDEIREKTNEVVDVHTVTTPDLKFSDEILVPFAIDTLKYHPIRLSDEAIIIGHSPTNIKIKGTEKILEVLNDICNKYKMVYVNMQQGLPFYYAIELKKINHIFIDQYGINAYGNSAVEAMAFGSAVLAGTDSGAPGVIDFNESTLYEKLVPLIEDKNVLYKAQSTALKHCIDTHSYRVISKKLDKVYDLAIERGNK